MGHPPGKTPLIARLFARPLSIQIAKEFNLHA
jgi:hypothetical protein